MINRKIYAFFVLYFEDFDKFKRIFNVKIERTSEITKKEKQKLYNLLNEKLKNFDFKNYDDKFLINETKKQFKSS